MLRFCLQLQNIYPDQLDNLESNVIIHEMFLKSTHHIIFPAIFDKCNNLSRDQQLDYATMQHNAMK